MTLDGVTNKSAVNPQRTDATGRYGMKLRPNETYYLVVTADGFATYTSAHFTEPSRMLQVDIALVPQSLGNRAARPFRRSARNGAR